MHAAILRAALVFFTFFIFFTNAPSARAAEVEVAGNGATRLTEQSMWKKTGVTVSPEALAFGDAWQKAYRNPGAPVPVKTRVLRETNGLFRIVIRTTIDKAVLYDENGKSILLVTDAGAETETKFNWFLVFAGIAAFAMIISNILHARRRSFSSAAFAAIAAAAFAVAAIAAAAFAAAAAVAAFVVAVVAFVVAVVADEGTAYRITSSIFYGALALSVILFYVYT